MCVYITHPPVIPNLFDLIHDNMIFWRMFLTNHFWWPLTSITWIKKKNITIIHKKHWDISLNILFMSLFHFGRFHNSFYDSKPPVPVGETMAAPFRSLVEDYPRYLKSFELFLERSSEHQCMLDFIHNTLPDILARCFIVLDQCHILFI